MMLISSHNDFALPLAFFEFFSLQENRADLQNLTAHLNDVFV